MTRRSLCIILVASCAFVLVPRVHLRSETTVRNLEHRTSLAGQWKMVIGDDKKYSAPDYDDASWDTVTLPGSLMPGVMKKTDRPGGILWLRKTLYVGRDLAGKDLGLILGRISDADEVFFNGVKIGGLGEFPPAAHSMWNHPRCYLVYGPIIRAGADNVIAIRVSYYLYSEVLGTMAVTGVKDWDFYRILSRFLIIDFNYFAIAMGFTLLLISLFYFIRRPGSREFLYYLLQLLFGFFITLELCVYWNMYGSMLARFKFLALAWAGVNVTHPIFLHRIYNLHRKKMELTLWLYLAVVVIVTLFIIDDMLLRVGGLGMIAITQCIGPYSISCSITALARRHPYAKLLGIFGIIVVLGAMHDGFLYFLKFAGIDPNFVPAPLQLMLFPYAALGFYIGTALILVARFAGIMKRVEDLNVNLENKVEERTNQLKEMADELEKKNRVLAEVALRDSLTGLYNHAAFHERLVEILNEAKRHRFPLCVVMIDVDNFKTFNDTYGHQVGDEILLKMSEVFKSGSRVNETGSGLPGEAQPPVAQVVRTYDLVGRYGGDEFILALPHCGEADVSVVSERMRGGIEAIRVDRHPELKITGSFGISILDENAGCDDAKELIALADKALYNAKSGGKNRIFILKYKQ
jgi:GGDEF domain-containing protein